MEGGWESEVISCDKRWALLVCFLDQKLVLDGTSWIELDYLDIQICACRVDLSARLIVYLRGIFRIWLLSKRCEKNSENAAFFGFYHICLLKHVPIPLSYYNFIYIQQIIPS